MLQPLFLLSSFCSILIGTFGALYQVRIKRFLAYTSISQAGYILLGIGCCSSTGLFGSIFHLFFYILSTLGFFCILINVSTNLDQTLIYIHEFNYFYRYNTEASYCLGIYLITMAGFPPMGTFFSKSIILSSLVDCN